MKTIVLLITIILSFTFTSNAQSIIYKISSQSNCTTSAIKSATNNAAWKSGLSLRVDEQVLDLKIIAFKLQWFNGAWSDWFIVGYNDLDTKFDSTTNNMRRMWSYFFDHSHQYIFCK